MSRGAMSPSSSETFCILPWIHVEVVPEGDCKVCCIAQETIREDDNPLNVATHPLEEIRRSRYMQSVRTALASGKRIPVCAHCWSQEKRGEISQRQRWNGWMADAVKRLDARVQAGHNRIDPMPLEYLQISVGNTCNLACRMCNASYSSRIEADPIHGRWAPRLDRKAAVVWKEAGAIDSDAAHRPGYSARFRTGWIDGIPWFEQPEFIEGDMMAAGASLKALYVTGGEPLFIPSFDRILDEFVRRGFAGNMTIGLNSNLFHNEGRISRVMQSLLKFRFCNMAPSVDGYGAVYEYIRYPAKWKVVERNIRAIKALMTSNRNLTLLLTTVAQAYNCFNLVDLFRFSDDLGIECNPHALEGPPYLSLRVLPQALRRGAAEALKAYVASPSASQTQVTNRDHAARIGRFLDGLSEGSEVERWRKAFVDFTRDLDQSRGQSLEESVPQLAGILETLVSAGSRG